MRQTAAAPNDQYRSFLASPCGDHPIVAGISPFQVEDELYVRQRGETPIQPLLQARSQLTGQVEPLAWTGRHGRGRIFQTLLGHSESGIYDAFGARETPRRAAAWQRWPSEVRGARIPPTTPTTPSRSALHAAAR